MEVTFVHFTKVAELFITILRQRVSSYIFGYREGKGNISFTPQVAQIIPLLRQEPQFLYLASDVKSSPQLGNRYPGLFQRPDQNVQSSSKIRTQFRRTTVIKKSVGGNAHIYAITTAIDLSDSKWVLYEIIQTT